MDKESLKKEIEQDLGKYLPKNNEKIIPDFGTQLTPDEVRAILQAIKDNLK